MVNSGVLGYRYNGRQWVVDAGLSFSEAQSWYRDRSRGHFYRLSTNMPGPVTLRIDDISYPKPGTFTVTNAAGAVVDYKNMDNYRLADTRSGPQDGKGLVPEAYVNVLRHLDGAGFPLALKTGFDVRRETRDNRRTNDIWTFVGPDHVANTADDTISSLGLLDTNYLNQNNYWGWKNIQWPSAYKAFEMYKQHPDYFARQDVNSETNRITGSEWLRETVSAAYLQIEAKFLQNRLRFVTGARYEKTQDRGTGPYFDPNAIYQRTAAGAFVRDAAGNRVRKVEAGAVGSLQELALLRQERGAKASRTYDGLYPSFHATYNVNDTTQVRFAYSLTLGRPELSNIIPNATINENASFTGAAGTTPGTITVTNTGLQPWETKNYDLSLEHYFAGGGMASAGVFRKSISDFWGNVNTPLTPALANDLGISSEYNGWNVISKVNTGSARVDGVEFNYQQPLKFAFLPDWARRFSVNANATQLHLMGSNDADFGNFIARTRNLGLTYSDKRAVVMLKWNFRGRQKQGLQSGIGPDAYNYYNPRSNVDVNAEYALSKHLSLFGNARNIFNVAQDQDAYGKNTPAYSRWAFTEEFGVQMAFGIKGSF
jgi:TonB-dependent receptor